MKTTNLMTAFLLLAAFGLMFYLFLLALQPVFFAAVQPLGV